VIAVTAAVVASLAAHQCTPRTVGPGAHVEGGTKGAACLLAAFRRCRSADYVLSGFGTGTIVIENFSVQHWEGGCAILVLRSIGSPQQQPAVTGPRVCRRLRATAAGVVADRCSRGKPAAVSLVRFR
jgi:hypothetical protein